LPSSETGRARPTATAAEYTASIDWGDGHTSAGTINGGAGSFAVSAPHTYAEEGSNTLGTITAPAAPTNTATAHSKATVGDGSLTAKPSNVQGRVAGVATSATPASGVVTTFTDANPGGTSADYSATIDWGDGTTTQGDISGPSTGAGPRQVSGTHTYYEDFNYTVKTTIRDRGGA
jgi:hypothetical protein